VGNDAEQNSPAGCKHYRVVAGQLFVEDENGEDDCGQSARAELTDEQLVGRSRSRPDQA
jgi:hypothetical protein